MQRSDEHACLVHVYRGLEEVWLSLISKDLITLPWCCSTILHTGCRLDTAHGCSSVQHGTVQLRSSAGCTPIGPRDVTEIQIRDQLQAARRYWRIPLQSTVMSTVSSDDPRAGCGDAARLVRQLEAKGRKSVELEMAWQPIESTRGQVRKGIVCGHVRMNVEPTLSPVPAQPPSRFERQADDVSVRSANH